MMIWRAIRCYYDDWGLSRSMPLVSMTVDRSALEREPPKLTVELNFLNYSLYDVQMNGVAGRIRFAGAELSGDVEGAASREIAERFQSVRVSATVWISETEAKSILDASGQNHLHFGLAGLKIYASAYRPVMGAKRRVLRIPDDIQVRTDGRWRVEGITDLLLDGN